jgi:hypothetical protein
MFAGTTSQDWDSVRLRYAHCVDSRVVSLHLSSDANICSLVESLAAGKVYKANESLLMDAKVSSRFLHILGLVDYAHSTRRRHVI